MPADNGYTSSQGSSSVQPSTSKCHLYFIKKCTGSKNAGVEGMRDLSEEKVTRPQDHASLSRQQENDSQTRLGRLEASLDRLIPLVETTHAWFVQTIGGAFNPPSASSVIAQNPISSSHEQQIPQSHPHTTIEAGTHQAAGNVDTTTAYIAPGEGPGDENEVEGDEQGYDSVSAEEQDEEDQEKGVEESQHSRTWADRLAGQFARDSTGYLRYLGGAPNFVLAEAVDSVRQANLPPAVVNSASSTPDGPTMTVDHLYFRPNVLYRPLNGLPAPETLEYPPMILSDTLVQLYFERIHHTFPIVDKPSFLSKYEAAMDGLRRGQPSRDAHFLCVLFAVYCSAASLTKKVFQDHPEFQFSSPNEYIGLEFYEKALYMYWSSFRMMTIDNVTCMAILSSCLAGWNTLSQAWVLAGQAVRGAQDGGLHRSPKKASMPASAKEHRRRVWWCVYGLDKILSVSLGRPSGINDDDCDVELPSDQTCCEGGDDQVERPGDNPMTGFKSLLKIYITAGRIERRAHNIHFLKEYDNDADHPEVRDTIEKLDGMLEDWSDKLPDSVRKLARNTLDADGCLLADRPFMPDFNTSSQVHTFNSMQKCMDAAEGCIRVGEEVKKLLPTSHHCQFCVQYLTISGVTLLRCLPYVSDSRRLIVAANRCRHLLTQLEDTWSGSKRCGALLQDLLDICKQKRSVTGQQRLNGLSTPATADPVTSSHSTPAGLKRAIDQVQGPDLSHPAKFRKNNALLEDRIPTVPTDHAAANFATSNPPNADIDPPQINPAQMQAPNAIPLDSQGWMDFSASPFDYAQLTSQAPFDLSVEIGALLESIEDSSSTYPETANQWTLWGANGDWVTNEDM